MQSKSVSILALVVTMVAGAAFATRASARTSYSEPFWRCSSGYAFETSGSAVHCKKPSWTETRAYMSCAIGLTLKYDQVGNTDMCTGITPLGAVSVEPACNPTDVLGGFTKRIVDGKDFCGKTHAAEIVAPSIVISL